MRLLQPKKNKKELYAFPLSNSGTIKSIQYRIENDCHWNFESIVTAAACVNCTGRPCMNYKLEEISTIALKEMPHNNSLNVCPVDAITLNESGIAPVIDSDKCITCGLCLSRCLYGAIDIHGAFATINDEIPTAIFEIAEFNQEKYDRRQSMFYDCTRHVEIIELSKRAIDHFYSSIDIQTKRNNNFENLLVRNLLVQLGVTTKTRAIGNNSIRMDLIGEQADKILIGEVDLNGSDLLDLTRGILDDISIAHSRHKIPKESIIPLIVLRNFPNKRSDYYEVISDIKKITGIEIKTISIQFLYMLQLHRQTLDLKLISGLFHANKINPSISDDCIAYFPEIISLDPYFVSNFYGAIK